MADAPLLKWKGRFQYLAAKFEERQMMLYGMDLLWLNVRPKYKTFTAKQPSSLFSTRLQPVDNRTARQVRDDLVRKLTGGGK